MKGIHHFRELVLDSQAGFEFCPNTNPWRAKSSRCQKLK